MSASWRKLEHGYIKPALRRLRPLIKPFEPELRRLAFWRQAEFAGVRVHYKRHLNGGGSSFGQDYVPVLTRFGMPRQARVFEWCSGPGFIGFSLLAHGLCETLCLADINEEAVAACRRTISDNRLTDRVTVYHSNNLASIPDAERWDLVVGNPPHFVDKFAGELRHHDPGWRIHRDFFDNIGRFSNRPFEVKRFQTIHHRSVDVARGFVLLFGIGTKAVPSWDSRTRRNNLTDGLAVSRRQVQATERTHLIHRPARDIIPPLGGARVSSYWI